MGVLGKYKNHIFDSETSYGISGIKNIRQKNPREIIVFATGCFDIAHSGHPLFIEQMRREGEKLAMKNQSVLVVIGLGKDSVIKKLKGNKRPVNPELNRAYLLASYKEVDYVILDNSEVDNNKIDFEKTLSLLRPDIFVLNDDDSSIDTKRKLCESSGITFKMVKRIVPDFLEPTSSSQIIEKIIR